MLTLETRQAIADLMHDYVHCIDDDDLERWPTLFAAQCLYRVVPRENADLNLPIAIMFCDSQGMLQDRVTAHRKANLFGAHFYRHIVSSIRITEDDSSIFSVRANYVVFRTAADAVHYGRTEVYSVGTYRDKVIFEEGTPKFREKIVIVDTSKISSLLVTPL